MALYDSIIHINELAFIVQYATEFTNLSKEIRIQVENTEHENVENAYKNTYSNNQLF